MNKARQREEADEGGLQCTAVAAQQHAAVILCTKTLHLRSMGAKETFYGSNVLRLY